MYIKSKRYPWTLFFSRWFWQEKVSGKELIWVERWLNSELCWEFVPEKFKGMLRESARVEDVGWERSLVKWKPARARNIIHHESICHLSCFPSRTNQTIHCVIHNPDSIPRYLPKMNQKQFDGNENIEKHISFEKSISFMNSTMLQTSWRRHETGMCNSICLLSSSWRLCIAVECLRSDSFVSLSHTDTQIGILSLALIRFYDFSCYQSTMQAATVAESEWKASHRFRINFTASICVIARWKFSALYLFVCHYVCFHPRKTQRSHCCRLQPLIVNASRVRGAAAGSFSSSINFFIASS